MGRCAVASEVIRLLLSVSRLNASDDFCSFIYRSSLFCGLHPMDMAGNKPLLAALGRDIRRLSFEYDERQR